MPLDTSQWEGTVFADFEVEATAQNICAFAEAVGEPATETAPHTFPISLYMSGPDGQAQLEQLGIPLNRVLHAEQGFEHHSPVRAGMHVTCSTRVATVTRSKSGAMIFVTFDIQFRNGSTALAEMRFALAVRDTK